MIMVNTNNLDFDLIGPVIFMEEDHYVAEDFLHVLWLQQILLKGGSKCNFCNQAHILSLGSYPKYFNHREASNMVIWINWMKGSYYGPPYPWLTLGWIVTLVIQQA